MFCSVVSRPFNRHENKHSSGPCYHHVWAVKRKSCPANCCPFVHLVIACYILYKHIRSGPWYHDRKLYDIYCKNMFVLVRGITTVNCMISTAQTCSFRSVVILVLFAALQHPVREMITNVVRCVLWLARGITTLHCFLFFFWHCLFCVFVLRSSTSRLETDFAQWCVQMCCWCVRCLMCENSH